MKKILKIIRPFVIPIVITLTVLFLFHYTFMLGYVPSSSMEPTLEAGSLILGLRHQTDFDKGDIIIFKHQNSYLVKRIAAVPGDYVQHKGETIEVPADHYYMLGDNQDESYDSRYWDDPFISAEDVIAKLLVPIK